MKARNLIGYLAVLFFYSCIQNTVTGTRQIEESTNQQSELNLGLRIENGINRGLAFTDSLGDKYAITYIPTTVINDSTFPINFQLDLLEEYNYPQASSDEKYKLIILPKEWALDGVGITENMMEKLLTYLDNHSLNETIEPNQKITFAIATYRPAPSKKSVPIPNSLFSQNDVELYKECDIFVDTASAVSTIPLWLKLIVDINTDSPWCILIHCGYSYAEIK